MRKWLLLLLLTFFAFPVMAQQVANQAVLVVVFGDGQSESYCVQFDEESISGYELLQRAGLELAVETSGMGTAVCSINDIGCPASDCFCQCRSADCEYWSFWQWQDETWQYANLGAHLLSVSDGTMQGWTWGPGSVTEAPPPPNVEFDDVCARQASTSTGPASSALTFPWFPYASFGLILFLLGGILLRRNRAAQSDKVAK